MAARTHQNSRRAGRATGRTRLAADERRETILRAAAEVFAEEGYRAGKVSNIAARIGVTEPVVFQNFGSKAALFAAVIERAAAEARASLDDMAAEFGSPAGLLAHVLTPATRDPSAASDPDLPHPGAAYRVLFADAVALATEPDITDAARAALRAVAAHLADLIRHAQVDEAHRTSADPEAAAWLLLSVLSARRLRAAAMQSELEPAVTALTIGAIAPGAGTTAHPR